MASERAKKKKEREKEEGKRGERIRAIEPNWKRDKSDPKFNPVARQREGEGQRDGGKNQGNERPIEGEKGRKRKTEIRGRTGRKSRTGKNFQV